MLSDGPELYGIRLKSSLGLNRLGLMRGLVQLPKVKSVHRRRCCWRSTGIAKTDAA